MLFLEGGVGLVGFHVAAADGQRAGGLVLRIQILDNRAFIGAQQVIAAVQQPCAALSHAAARGQRNRGQLSQRAIPLGGVYRAGGAVDHAVQFPVVDEARDAVVRQLGDLGQRAVLRRDRAQLGRRLPVVAVADDGQQFAVLAREQLAEVGIGLSDHPAAAVGQAEGDQLLRHPAIVIRGDIQRIAGDHRVHDVTLVSVLALADQHILPVERHRFSQRNGVPGDGEFVDLAGHRIQRHELAVPRKHSQGVSVALLPVQLIGKRADFGFAFTHANHIQQAVARLLPDHVGGIADSRNTEDIQRRAVSVLGEEQCDVARCSHCHRRDEQRRQNQRENQHPCSGLFHVFKPPCSRYSLAIY